MLKSWSSLDKGESLTCQITSPFKKIGCFCKAIFLILSSKTTHLIVEWRSYLARSVTRLGNFLLFVQLFKAFGNN